jgi:hypothetical protein
MGKEWIGRAAEPERRSDIAMTYIWDRQRDGFGAPLSLPMGFLGLAEAGASFGGDSVLQKWATDLATIWAGRITTKPDERQRELKKKMDWLAKDYEVVLAGAQKRQGLRKYSSQTIIRAWQVTREQQMDFATLERSPYLPKTFAPPAGAVPGVVTPLVKYSDKYPVAPLVAGFMQKLLQLYPQARADTYANHGGGAFRGRGFSIDLWLDRSPRDARGFWRPEDAVALLRAVHQAARAVGAEWRVLYNDYSVARIINQETGARRVGFVAGAFPNGGLNWHGPHPLILHFHLDLAPMAAAAAGASPQRSTLPSQPAPSQSGAASPIVALPGILADAVKSGGLTLIAASQILAGERDANKLTNLIFYARHPKLPVGYKIQPQEQALAREWMEIRDKLVIPVLQRLRGAAINNPKPRGAVPAPAKPNSSVKLNRFRALLPFLNRDRVDIPLEFLLGWIDVESGGSIGIVTQSLNERGYFQIHPDESKTLRLDHERLSRDPEYSINSGIRLVKQRALRAQQLGFTYGTDLFWHMVKLLHWLPKGVQVILAHMRQHGFTPTTWAEFKMYVESNLSDLRRLIGGKPGGGWDPIRGIHNVEEVFKRGKQLAADLATPQKTTM